QEVTDQWYSEIKLHQFGGEPRSLSTGHFTQVVWKGSKEVGVGRAVTRDGKVIVVANYRPAGNMVGSFGANVLPPKDGKILLPAETASKPSASTTHHTFSSEGPGSGGHFSQRFEEMRRDFGAPSSHSFSSGGFSSGGTRTESRSVRTYTVTEGSGPNKVTKTITEETIIKPDGEKIVNRKETTTSGGGKSSTDPSSMGIRVGTKTYDELDHYSFSSFVSFPHPSSATLIDPWEDKAGHADRVISLKHADVGCLRLHHGKKRLCDGCADAEAGFGRLALKDSGTDDKAKKKSSKPFWKSKRSSSSSSDSSPERGGKSKDKKKKDKSARPQKMSDFQEECLKAHNSARAKHGVPALTLAKDLNEHAQKWAEELVNKNMFQHSACMVGGNRVGENIANKWSSAPGGADYTGQEAVDQWYSEIKKHNYHSDGAMGSGHFTQVVWKGSKELGVGKAKDASGKVIVVANYRPAGNMIGTYKENVFPPK
ncbi:hypothetical protein BaRGS_00035034, partial [Batillaria attramentaria]